MKRRPIINIACLLIALVVFFATGCKKNATTKQKDAFTITSTFYPLHIMLLNITDGIPDVSVSLLAPADTGCLHDYQLTTRDMRLIEDCNVLVMNGAAMEDFLDKALSMKQPEQIITAAEGWSLLDDNPHIWVSPQGAIHQTQQIAEGLAKADPDHAEQYLENARTYVEKLSSLSNEMHARLDKYAGRSIMTFHEAFPYFASEFNLNLLGTIEQEHGSEPSVREITEAITVIRNMQRAGDLPLLFAEPEHTSSVADVVATETGLTVYELNPAVTGNLDKNAYIQIMMENVSVLEEALSQT